MFKDDIRSALRNRPFAPFVVHTSDGESFRVHHPDYAFLSPVGESLQIYGEDGRKLAWLQVGQITRFDMEQRPDEPVETTTKPRA